MSLYDYRWESKFNANVGLALVESALDVKSIFSYRSFLTRLSWGSAWAASVGFFLIFGYYNVGKLFK